MTPQATTLPARVLQKETSAPRAVPREDSRWTRPIFRPPPLVVHPARLEFPYSGTIHRTELLAPLSGSNTPAR